MSAEENFDETYSYERIEGLPEVESLLAKQIALAGAVRAATATVSTGEGDSEDRFINLESIRYYLFLSAENNGGPLNVELEDGRKLTITPDKEKHTLTVQVEGKK
jgi:hypothetical protein